MSPAHVSYVCTGQSFPQALRKPVSVVSYNWASKCYGENGARRPLQIEKCPPGKIKASKTWGVTRPRSPGTPGARRSPSPSPRLLKKLWGLVLLLLAELWASCLRSHGLQFQWTVTHSGVGYTVIQLPLFWVIHSLVSNSSLMRLEGTPINSLIHWLRLMKSSLWSVVGTQFGVNESLFDLPGKSHRTGVFRWMLQNP